MIWIGTLISFRRAVRADLPRRDATLLLKIVCLRREAAQERIRAVKTTV